MSARPASPARGAACPKIGFVSLGCPKALTDSEQILTRLRAEGYLISPSYEDADLVVVNTCGFIDDAIKESLDAIGEALTENGKVIVTGCLGARETLIRAAHPHVLAVTGPHAADEVMRHIRTHLSPPEISSRTPIPPQGIRLTPPHFAYLKISEGCDHACAFCVIPALRGPLASRPVGDILEEADALVRAGVKELLIVSQDTGAYGRDLRHRTGFYGGRPIRARLRDLCEALARFGLWVRLHYLYPYPSIDDLLPLMAEGKILPYLDIPFQHAHPRVLRTMKRPANAENTLERLRVWREICPDITIRSTFMTGFPGETDAEFEALLDFLREARLDRVGCFAYSPVEGAPANALPGALPETVREERRRRLMEVQEAISAERLAAKIGMEITVLVDTVDEDGMIARSTADAPEIDGCVFIEETSGARPGDFLQVRILEADAHDLYAERVAR